MEQKIEVFISYSMEDKEFLDPFVRRLQRNYKLLLYDALEKPSGKIVDDLRTMQRNAAGTIVFWTKQASNSERIKNEMETAFSYLRDKDSGKFLVVITREDSKLPSYLTGVQTFNADRMNIDTIMTGIEEVIYRHGYGPGEKKSGELRLPVSSITEIQTILNLLEFFYGKIDGRLGPQTSEAVKKFQEKNHLPVTGKSMRKLMMQS